MAIVLPLPLVHARDDLAAEALWYAQLPARYREKNAIDWPGKVERTFSDAITAVRRWLWTDWLIDTYLEGDVVVGVFAWL